VTAPPPSRPAGVFDVLDAARATCPDAVALVTRSATLTYADFDDRADTAAGALYRLGVRPGDRVAGTLPNDVDIVVAFHGAMRLGAIWVGVSRALAPPEKSYLITDSEAYFVLADDAGAAELEGRLRAGIELIGPARWQDAMDGSAGRAPVPPPDPEAPAAIAYTSGTTGYPKGAVHCQAGLILPGAAAVARRGWGRDLRKGDSLPLTILNMQVLTTLLTAQAGGTAVIMDGGDVASVVDWIRRERVTVWNGPPAQLHTMIADQSITAPDLGSLDEVWVGGGDCPDRLRASFEARFRVRVSRTYGLTEAPALVSLDDLAGEASEGTSGRPLDHVEVSAEGGELLLSARIAGPWTGRYRPLLGYWNQPQASAAALAGGVLHTGDLGVVEGDGSLRVVGRKSQVIIRGGANVYPAEVERVLAEAPGVGACAVVGVPDERLGERVGAVIEPRPGEAVNEAAVLSHCRAALAAYKVPERLLVVDRLPRNQMGKVPPAQVRELLAEVPPGA
jgi:long-chain acyl-CoA synthetase